MTYGKANQTTRKRGKDKQKDRYKKNGKFTSKHLRQVEKIRDKPNKPETKKII